MPRAIIMDHLDKLVDLKVSIIKLRRELTELESLFDQELADKKDQLEEKLSELAFDQLDGPQPVEIEYRTWGASGFAVPDPPPTSKREGYDDGSGV